MRAKYRETRKYSVQSDTPVDLNIIAGECRLRVVEHGQSFVRLRCRMNFWSFGENIEISVSTVNGELVIDVSSECVLATQIEDWGKNRKNVERIFLALQRQIGVSVWRLVPTCTSCGYLLAGIDTVRCPECGIMPGSGNAIRPFRKKLRGVLVFVVTLSAIEIAIGFAFRAIGMSGMLGPFATLRGVITIVLGNVVVGFGIVFLGRAFLRKH